MNAVRGVTLPHAPDRFRLRFLGSEGGETGSRLYVYTDPLGMAHLVAESWGRWTRYDAGEIAAECRRCSALYSEDIAAQEASGAWPCTYEYMYSRRAGYERLLEAVTAAFPDARLAPAGEIV